MTNRSMPFIVGEWYHCHNRAIDKRLSFVDAADYRRFLELLYLANDEFALRRAEIGRRTLEEVLSMPRGKRLVSIGAFCLMPSHFHLALQEVTEGGISAFMRKLGTAYTMYFNARHSREGNLFLKPFQAIQVSTERNVRHLISYVHADPAHLYEPEWRRGTVLDPQFLEEHLLAYQYSSLGAHRGMRALGSSILDKEVLAAARTLPVQKLLQEARQHALDVSIP